MNKIMQIGLGCTLVLQSLNVWAADHPKCDAVGLVADISGTWYLESASQPLQRGQGVPENSVIHARQPHDRRSFLVIAFFDERRQPEQRLCEIPGACASPLELPSCLTSESPSIFQRVMIAVGRMFAHDPERYIPTLSRGRSLRDGVVEVANGQGDVHPILSGTQTGVYQFELQALSRQTATDRVFGPFQVQWQQQEPALVPLGDLAPGLYQMRLLDSDSLGLRPTGEDAWVLVCPAENSKTAATFQEAEALIQQWGKDLRLTTRRSILRAYLEYLATQGA